MMPAAKMMDPIVGLDLHLIQPPGPVPPLPIPHPFIGMLFDASELAPVIGATVWVNGMPKATAGSAGKAVPPHIPMGGVFVPPPPGNECEMFMGSATVLFEDEPASYTALPALSCQSVGMPAPFRKKKKAKPILKLPTSVVFPIPAGPPVLIGGPPMISMNALSAKIKDMVKGAALKKLKKWQKKSKWMKKASQKIHNKAKKAMDKLGVPKSMRNAVHKQICTVTGHPVDVATGKVFTENVDFGLPGPIPFNWERTWFSTSKYDGPLGRGWHHSWDLALADEGGGIAVRMADGRPAGFPRLAPGEEHYDRSEKSTLRRDERGYALVDAAGLAYRFSEVPSPKGVHPVVAVTDAAGNRIRFAYGQKGELTGIEDSAGRRLLVQTDAMGRILAIHAPHPHTEGDRFAIMSYAYDANGDLVEARDALGKPWTYRYRNHVLSEETNRNGVTFKFEYDRWDADGWCLRTWGDGGIYDHRLAYDRTAKVTVVKDSLGHETTYHLNDSGMVSKVVDALGNVSETKLNEYNEPAEEIDELGGVTAYEYDDRGDCVKLTTPDGGAVSTEFSAGLAVKMGDAMGDAMGGEWAFEWDAERRLVKQTDPLGRATAFAYKGPLMEKRTDPDGGVTRFAYDSWKNLILQVDPDGAETRWEYDALGRCTASMDAEGGRRTWSYDLGGGVCREEEPDGESREIEYDGEGNAIRVKDRMGEARFKYEGMNRLAAQWEDGVRVDFLYDTEEQLVGLKNAAGMVYRFAFGPTGEIIEETGFDGTLRRFSRDALGRAIRVDRPEGRFVEYEYDADDNVLKAAYSDGEEEIFAYRADGELLEADNGKVKVAFEHDIVGQVIKELQGDRWVESAYDAGGNRVSLKSSLGAAQGFLRGADGGVDAIEAKAKDGAAWEGRFKRDRLGHELEAVLPGGLKSSWTRDKAGRPLTHILAGPAGTLRSREYRWDTQDRIKALSDSRHGVTQFSHGAMGFLEAAKTGSGEYLFRMPDALGNLFRSQEKDDRTFGPAGQLIEARGPKGTTHYEYDPEGNLAARVEPGGRRWEYCWTVSGRLAAVTRPDGSEVRFEYDALGRRISKTHRGRTTRWVWDGETPLHEWVEATPQEAAGTPSAEGSPGSAEAAAAERKARLAAIPPLGPPPPEAGSADRPITWIFEPDGFTPLGKMVAGKSWSILTDHSGAPFSMVDEKGVETWSLHMDVYGAVSLVVGGPEACPFRFPGQYEDVETGLYYNRFRYYDPEAGTYISQDPIRTEGGLNLHAYVEDPEAWCDPLGLKKCGPKGSKNPKVRKSARTGQEAHRQIQKKLRKQGYKTEVPLTLKGGKKVRKDAMKGKTAVIIKPDTPSGRRAGRKRAALMKKNGYKPKEVYYDPTNPAYKPGSSTYIGPS